jgi:hypothetical protein
MVNKYEIDPQLNRSDIPENWDFSAKLNPCGFKIQQLDLKQRFLAVRTLDDRSSEQHFFDGNGTVIDDKYQNNFGRNLDSTRIILRSRDNIVFFETEGTSMQPNLETMLSFGGQARIDKNNENSNDVDSLALFKYVGSNLIYIKVNDFFYFSKETGKIIGPKFTLNLIKENSGEESQQNNNINVHIDIKGVNLADEDYSRFTYPMGNGVNFGSKGNDFRVEWDIRDGRFIVRQVHKQTGISKIMKSPLTVDLENMKIAVSAEPRYGIIENKIGPDRLDVPWSKIDQIIGASVGYQMSAPQGTKL